MELKKSDKIFLNIILILILTGILIIPPILHKSVSFLRIILLSIVVILFLFVVNTSKNLSPPKAKSKVTKKINLLLGIERKIKSIILKIAAIASLIIGVYVIIDQNKYWGLGFLIIFISPLTWYLSIQINKRAQEFFQANK